MIRMFRRRDPLDRVWRISRTGQDFDTCSEAAAAYRARILWIRHRSAAGTGYMAPLDATPRDVVAVGHAVFCRTLEKAQRARRRLQSDHRYQGGQLEWAMACVFDQATGENLTVPGLPDAPGTHADEETR